MVCLRLNCLNMSRTFECFTCQETWLLQTALQQSNLHHCPSEQATDIFSLCGAGYWHLLTCEGCSWCSVKDVFCSLPFWIFLVSQVPSPSDTINPQRESKGYLWRGCQDDKWLNPNFEGRIKSHTNAIPMSENVKKAYSSKPCSLSLSCSAKSRFTSPSGMSIIMREPDNINATNQEAQLRWPTLALADEENISKLQREIHRAKHRTRQTWCCTEVQQTNRTQRRLLWRERLNLRNREHKMNIWEYKTNTWERKNCTKIHKEHMRKIEQRWTMYSNICMALTALSSLPLLLNFNRYGKAWHSGLNLQRINFVKDEW